jgi:predicted nucleic acid-binding protein
LLAGQALTHGVTLVSADRTFQEVPGLRLLP